MAAGYPFVGLLFTGIMVTKSGPKTLEYNVRFGDPETQTLLPLLSADTDLAEIMLGCTDRWLKSVETKIDQKFSATVVASAGGYPGTYVKGEEIKISPSQNSSSAQDGTIFHAGTALAEGGLKTAGGRVIASNATANALEDAITNAYSLMKTIYFKDMHYRTDIGQKALRRKQAFSIDQAMTYAAAGVSVSSGNELVDRIKPLVASTARPGAAASIGGFGGELDLSAAGYTEVSTTDMVSVHA